jgi:hypothetical protein
MADAKCVDAFPSFAKEATPQRRIELYQASFPHCGELGLRTELQIRQTIENIFHEVNMNRKNPLVSANPFLAWTTLAMKTWEMLFASAQVIGHRTGRMALAGPAPGARDRREFQRMGMEKAEAAAESAQAMALRMFSANQQLGLTAMRQMLSGWNALASLANSRTIPQTLKLQNDLLQNTMFHANAATSQLADSFARTIHKGLTPIHSRATANARRLSRTKLIA